MTPEEIFGSVAVALQAAPGVTQARMFGTPGLKVGTKAFAMVYKGKLVVKLPRERVQAMVAAGQGQPFDPGSGRVMKEWVAVGPGDLAGWVALAEEARDFVAAVG